MSKSLRVPSEQISSGHTSNEAQSKSIQRRLSRSPHPYHRFQNTKDVSLSGKKENGDPGSAGVDAAGRDLSCDVQDHAFIEQGHWRPKASTSPDDSGTEADDESFTFLKGLPAPPSRPRKGLRVQESDKGDTPSPLLTPSYLDSYGGKSKAEYHFAERNDKASEASRQRGRQRIPVRVQRQRIAELARRVIEIILVGVIGAVALQGHDVLNLAWTEYYGTATTFSNHFTAN